MWAVLGLDGEPLATFPAGLRGWRRALRWAEMNGGELDIVFMAYVQGDEE